MTSFLAASLLFASVGQVGPQTEVRRVPSVQSQGGSAVARGGFSLTFRGTKVQSEVWDSIKGSVAMLPDAAGHNFGLAVLISRDGYFLAHSSAIIAEPVTALLEDGHQVRLGRIGYDSTTQLVLLGAQNWMDATRDPIHVADPTNPSKDMTMVTSDGLVRSYISQQNIPGQVASNNRYLPLNEVQFESTASPVGGALLFNRSGELSGILGATLVKASKLVGTSNFANPTSFGPQSLTVGYALSPKVLRRVVNGFLTPSHKVQHPNIGILFKDHQPTGAVLTQVSPESPAAKAGLLAGDVITLMDNEAVPNALDFATALFDKDPGETIALEYTRDLVKHKATVVVGVGDALTLVRIIQTGGNPEWTIACDGSPATRRSQADTPRRSTSVEEAHPEGQPAAMQLRKLKLLHR